MTRTILPADVRRAATVEAVIALAATTNPADGWFTDAIVDQCRQELAAVQANHGAAAMDCGRLGAERAALRFTPARWSRDKAYSIRSSWVPSKVWSCRP